MMSQSMTRKLQLEGFGFCIAYGKDKDMGIGLPIEVDENRPLVVAHPAAANHYHASMSLFEDAGHPFVHALVDFGQFCPDEWPYHANVANHANYQRLHDTSTGDPVFRKVFIDIPHWQIHHGGDAFEYLMNAPPVDVLYVDWFSWIDRFIINDDVAFADMMAQYASKIRDGGLVIVDHKHREMGEGGCRWFNHPGGFFALDSNTQMEEVCDIEWLGGNANDEVQTYAATVFKVHHSANGPLGHHDWFEAIKPWFWNTAPEMGLSPSQVQHMLDEEVEESVHPNAITWENWHDTWSTVYMDDREEGMTFKTPVPPRFAWPYEAYSSYLQWLVNHPQCLQVEIEKRSYKLQGENFVLNVIHGDLIELAPALYTKHSAIAVRNKLQQHVKARCPWWKHQTTTIQTRESWSSNPIQPLQWSGENATPNLAKLLIEHSKVQSLGATYYNSRYFQCREIITVAHGTATLNEAMAAVEAYYEEIGQDVSRPLYTLELTIVHLDEHEYQDLNLPLKWRRGDSDE
tara:strand:- start:92 stop:1639 length:1548 start_codon:yes stop_codon:yes gene_type:complete